MFFKSEENISSNILYQSTLSNFLSNLYFLHPPEVLPNHPPRFIGLHIGLSNVGFNNYKVQIDVAQNKVIKACRLAWLVDELENAIVQGGGMYGLATSALHAEAQALLNVVIRINRQCMHQVTNLTACANLISSLQSISTSPSISRTLRQILVLAKNIHSLVQN